ncbi:MAG: tRNA 2-thiocytidine biosynthesis TtcA family protein [Sphaerochaetaceae bacterium]|nr:tRNA 2-thiocytidine biosynthesis TtcA family protein [Sphaerochaetaceae bacterium]
MSKKEPVKSKYESNKLSYRNIIEGNHEPWVMRFIKQTGKGINDFDMIREGETVLMAVSGGKDSLAMALALSQRLKWLPVKYNLKALMINWIEHPIPEEYRPRLCEYFSDLGIDFTIMDERQFPESFDGEFNCYLCARNRRRILFSLAQESGIRLIAMGHHLDDLVETTIMNLFFRAEFAPMNPVQEFFDGQLYVIRPMIEVHESVTKRLAEVYDLPVIKPVCPYDQTNIRSSIKPIVSEIVHLDKLAREHVFNAHDYSECRIRRETDDKKA